MKQINSFPQIYLLHCHLALLAKGESCPTSHPVGRHFTCRHMLKKHLNVTLYCVIFYILQTDIISFVFLYPC